VKDPNEEDAVEEDAVVLSPSRRVGDYVLTIAATLFVAFLLKTFVIEAFRIPSGSMEDTLHIGDFLFVNKFIYGAETPKSLPLTNIEIPHFRLPALSQPNRGDVIVFEYPGDRDEKKPQRAINYIKRCIAVGGDTLLIQNKTVFVNGREFLLRNRDRFARPSDFLPRESIEWMFPKGSSFNPDYYGPIIVPQKGMSLDLSRGAIEQWQTFIERENHRVEIANGGTVLIDDAPATVYTVERDYLFMMGDNRDNSLDSRFWGFVPKENIVGKAMFVYWSWDTSIPIDSIWEKFSAIRWSRIGTLIR
jgi:signal peptidase I